MDAAAARLTGQQLARAELRTRLERLVARARRRRLHPSSGRRLSERFL